MKNYSILIENDLISLAQKQNDHFAIEELLCRYKNTVRAIARRFYTTNGDIEDLVQEGMITLYHTILSYNNRKIPFKNYLFICIERKMISMVRLAQCQKNKPLQNYLPLVDTDGKGQDVATFETPEDRILGNEALSELLNKMQQHLSYFEYSILQLYTEGLTITEIATIQNTTAKSVDNALQRAKKKIRRFIQSESLSIVPKVQTEKII